MSATSAVEAAPAAAEPLVPKNIRWEWHHDTDWNRTCLTITGEIAGSLACSMNYIPHAEMVREGALELFVIDAVNHFFSAADTMIRAHQEQPNVPQNS